VTESEFNARRAWLDELLSLAHLWPWQVVQVLALAEELGVRVRIYDKMADWNYQINEWRQRQEVKR